MNLFQVDQCMDSKRFVESCASAGVADVRRFPRRRAGQKDPEILRAVLSTGRTLITTDRGIHIEHAAHFPEIHPGVVIVAVISPGKTLTTRQVARILSHFKQAFPEWHRVTLRNSVVEVTEVGVEVWKVGRGMVDRSGYLDFQQTDWQSKLIRLLDENAGAETAESD